MTRHPDDIPKHGQKRDDHWHGLSKHQHAFRLPDGKSDGHSHSSELHEAAVDAGEVYEQYIPATYAPILHEADKTFKQTNWDAR